MLKRRIRFLATITLVIAVMLSATVPAFAATGKKTSPYGYLWLNQGNLGGWQSQYYTYSGGTYWIEDYVTLRSSTLTNMDGDVITTSAKSFTDEEKPTIGFNSNGYFYFILSDKTVARMTSSTASTYSVSSTSANYFVLDEDDLVEYVATSSSSKTAITSLKFSGTYYVDGSCYSGGSSTSSSSSSSSYVKTYAYNGEADKIAHDAYRNGVLLLSVYCKNSNVWLETWQTLLSDTCVGAKFVGYYTDYRIILYDTDGILYYFLYGDYDTAYSIRLGEEIVDFEKDSNGFISAIVTKNNTYKTSTLFGTSSSSYYTSTTVASVTNSTSSSISYNSNGTKLGTLTLKSNYLYWDGNKLDNSYSPTYFGITEDNYPIWINSSGSLYYQNEYGNVSRIATGVTRLRTDSAGRVYQYVIGTTKYDIF